MWGVAGPNLINTYIAARGTDTDAGYNAEVAPRPRVTFGPACPSAYIQRPLSLGASAANRRGILGG